jgi:hypothetical protein
MRALLVTLITLAAVTLAAVGAAAMARTATDPLPSGGPPLALDEASAPTRTPAEALAMDAQAYAKRYGVTAAEARDRIPRQGTLGAALDRLEQRYPDRFAGGWIEHVPSFRAVARFTGAVPADARDVAGPGVVLRPNAPKTLVQLETLAERVFDDVADTWNATVTTGVDVKTGFVELAVETPAHLRGLGDAQLHAQLPESARRPGVRAGFFDAPVWRSEHAYGGDWLVEPDGGGCTSGFAVYDLSSGSTGVLTAGHCSNDYDYDPDLAVAGDEFDTDYVDGHRGEWGDVQWHTTDDHTDFDEFYDSDDDRRELTGYRETISNGDFFCKYGRVTGYDCSEVDDKRFSVKDEDGYRLKKLVVMEDAVTDDGDSGGPWFIDGLAVGVHSGTATQTFGDTGSTFSWIGYVDDALDVGLLNR